MFSPRYIREYPSGDYKDVLVINTMENLMINGYDLLGATNKRLIAYIKVNLYDFKNGIWVLRDESYY